MNNVSLLRRNCQPVGFYQGQMIYNSRNPDTGLWDAYVGQKSITSAQPDLSRSHRGASDVHGSLVLLEAATGTDANQEPGKGVNNDLVLIDLANPEAGTRLTSSTGDAGGPRPVRQGTIWAKFRPDGQRICWAELAGNDYDWWNEPLGYWEIHTADLISGALANEQTYPPRSGGLPTTANFRETYGWLPDGRLVFASDNGMPPNPWGHWLGAQLWAMADQPGATPVRLTPSWPGNPNPYCEFAAVAPVGMFADGPDPWILYSTIYQNTPSGGMDLWRLCLATGQALRVTNFNATSYAVVCVQCFDPADPHTIYAGVALDANSKSVDAYQIKETT